MPNQAANEPGASTSGHGIGAHGGISFSEPRERPAVMTNRALSRKGSKRYSAPIYEPIMATRGISEPAMTIRPLRYSNAVVPHIYIQGAAKAVAFYAKAFGAEEVLRIAAPDGRIVHCELAICNATVMLGDPTSELYDEPRQVGACTAGLHLMVDDNAVVLARAVAAGCEQVQPPTEMFYGANSASVRDPFGHVWVLLTWKEDLSPAEIERRGRAALDGGDPKARS
ncbi:VOC family protein [Mesorhizobium captivum]|uniref:VOC family protein n=1 Tax=Mesorhizobium captivum TaxID=3072319 RepID=UPI002A241F28|nr:MULTISPECIES: VOC family protein [unclassified Mesorhizobium]MDX8448513.1 VOC family protein [Mesorhizobium sp. VK3C]MDX8505509.1 VOC family protein [Mesorhizobium sp. VK22E]